MHINRGDVEDLSLGTLALFCRVAESESFVATARERGLSAGSISRAIGRLESRVGVRLFERTTRKVRLSEAGHSYYLHCRAALDELSAGEALLNGQQAAPEGVVRLSIPTPLGHRKLLPLFQEFSKRHPGIRLHIHLGNRNVDLISEGFDIAVRGRVPPDSGLIVRPLFDAPLIVVASRAYLEQAGVPRTPADLVNHDCIQFVLPSTGSPVPWQFRDSRGQSSLTLRGTFTVADDLLGTITLARHGAGLIQVPRFMVEDELRDGEFSEVLTEYAGETRRFSLIYPSRDYMPSRVKLVVDFLLDALGDRQ